MKAAYCRIAYKECQLWSGEVRQGRGDQRKHVTGADARRGSVLMGEFRRQDYMSLTGVFPKQQDCWHLGASQSDTRLGRVVHVVKLWRHERHKSEGSQIFPLWFQKAAETT